MKVNNKMSFKNSHTWKILSLGFVAFVMVFGMAPVLGEQIQASLLTSNLAAQQPVDEKEAVTQIRDFVDRCERLGLTDCNRAGRAALGNIGTVSFTQMLEILTSLQTTYGKDLAHAACRFDLHAMLFRVRDLQRELNEYSQKYAADFSSLPIDELESVVESCT